MAICSPYLDRGVYKFSPDYSRCAQQMYRQCARGCGVVKQENKCGAPAPPPTLMPHFSYHQPAMPKSRILEIFAEQENLVLGTGIKSRVTRRAEHSH